MMSPDQRAYRTTHPWIDFQLDLARSPYQFWMDLGAVQSKVEHVANALLPPKVARQLHRLYLAKGVHGTTAIEGNTLSEDQVRVRIAGKAVLPESQAYLGQEVDNIVAACNEIGREMLGGSNVDLNAARIRSFNRVVLEGLALEEGVVAGEFRRHSVVVGKYRGAPSEDCPYLVQRLCQWLSEIKPPSPELAVGFAVLRAIVAHLYIAWIHPFGDGNGRTARLVEFQILLAGGVPSVAAHLLSNFYNQTRAEYYRQLAAASQSGGDVRPFLVYALRGFRDALNEQIRVIRKHQWTVAWRDHVYSRFRGRKGSAADRRRLLALELAKAVTTPIPVSKLKRLTPELAECYAGKTRKTLTRDVNELVKMQLAVPSGQGVTANHAVLTEFLPRRRSGSEERPLTDET